MDVLKQLNESVSYLEKNLCGEIDLNTAARIACISKDSYLRFFSYMTGMSLPEYIRRRRLTLAAYDLQNTGSKVIDLAVKYGWNSADAFAKAFQKQHGITPTQARRSSVRLKIYPPASFYLMIRGAKEMDFRIVEWEGSTVYGVSKQYDGQGYQSKEELRHIMWSDDRENIPWEICRSRWNQTDDLSYDGIWYGVWHNGRYMLARSREHIKNTKLEEWSIPAGTYAAFRTKPGGLAWEELPKLFEMIFHAWFPNSGYLQNGDIILEVYHLWTEHETRRKNRYYEVWVPVKKADRPSSE